MSGSHQNYDDDDDDIVPPVILEQGFHNYVFIDNLPVVEAAKIELFNKLLTKILSAVGTYNKFNMPTDPDTKKTKGFAFVEFTSPDVANTAVQKLNGHVLDKYHTLRANKFADFEKLDKVADEYKPLETPETPSALNLQSWLWSPTGYDQFLIMADQVGHGDLLQYVGAGDRPRPIYSRKDGFTEEFFVWSPHGTYLATLHSKGLQLHGGGPNQELVRLRNFTHPQVKEVEFSPCENFVVTFSRHGIDEEQSQYIIWDVRTGQARRRFPVSLPAVEKDAPPNSSPTPCPFLWSHDDKYVARLNKGAISVYDTTNFSLLDQKSITFNSPVKDFSWSPGANILACWVPEHNSTPARVVLQRLPDRKEIASKPLVNVSKCGLRWQSAGDYLCVIVERQKTKKQSVTTFELFRMKEKDIPVEAVDLEQWVGNFAWEPKGKRFAIIHAEQPQPPRPNVSFYEMGPKKVQHIVTLEKRQVNKLSWSPAGRFIVLASMRSMTGTLEFYNVHDKETMATAEHELLTLIQWDPTGRFVATEVSQFLEKLENGYIIWSFQGKKLVQEQKQKFYQFLWRPRPPSPLTKEDEKSIQKEWKSLTEKYAKEDEAQKSVVKQAKRERKQKMRAEYDQVVAARRKAWEAEQAKLAAKTDYIVVEEIIEEVIEVTEEVLAQ